MTPCSRAHGKRCSPAHAALVSDYQDARIRWENTFEAETTYTYRRGLISKRRRDSRRGGRNEIVDFIEENPPITFREWLIGHAGANVEPERQADPWA